MRAGELGIGSLVQWPNPIDEEAYYGLAGDFVRAVAPHTEADPVALLVQLLAFFGNCVGRGPHFMAEADRHALLFYPVLVGQTSRGRKGTSLGHVRRLFEPVAPDWLEQRTSSGLSSGEGLISALKDDPASAASDKDKRLLVIEPEFAGLLKMIQRDGNVLSPIIRQAWDGSVLRVLTKNDPCSATGTHITIIGHITVEELRAALAVIEMANGFGNRFAWFCTKRSKFLPDGGRVDPLILQPLQARLKDALEFGRVESELKRDDVAADLWRGIYADLSQGRSGLAGSMTARAEAQVMRIACIYARLDGVPLVCEPHLRAALAVWKYAESSVAFIFGDAVGDPIADRILSFLRQHPGGASRTEIRDLFKRHAQKDAVDRALDALVSRGLARSERVDTEGRPKEIWFAVDPASTADVDKTDLLSLRSHASPSGESEPAASDTQEAVASNAMKATKGESARDEGGDVSDQRRS